MNKEAKTKHPIAEILANRWSPRAFDEKIPSDTDILSLVEAARWAPSSFNEQPWRIVMGIKGRGNSYDKVYDCLNEFNQAWAVGAPVLLIICAKETFSHNDKENKHFMYDCGAAMTNFCAQATHIGLYVHQMAGFSPEKARENLKVPNGFRPVTAAAVGYIGDAEKLSKDHRKSEKANRERKDLDEISFLGEFGESYS